MSIFKQFRSTLASIGWIDSFWYALHRLLNGISKHASIDKYYIVAQSTSRTLKINLDHGKSIETREILVQEPVVASFPRPPDVIARRFAQGAHCYGAFSERKLAGFIWLQPREYFEDEIRCHFAWRPESDGVWSFDVYVAPEHRIGMTFIKLWHDTETRLRAQGIKWTIGRISAFNVRSRTSHQRMGWYPVGKCVFIVIGKWQFMLSNRRPFIHMSFGPKQVPNVVLKFPT